VRVNDAATGKPTPVRIRFTDAEGKYYPPLGRLAEDDLYSHYTSGFEGNVLCAERAYAYIDGTCEIPLPPGLLYVEVHKGPEYTPLIQEIHLAPGKMALRLVIERWADLRRDGWYSGELGPHQLTPHAALLEAACEDISVCNLLAYPSGGEDEDGLWVYMPNLLAFSGQRPALESGGHLVVVNTQNTHLALGTLALLNCHRPVFPLNVGDLRSSSPPGRAALGDWTLSDWCDQCHRKQGLVVWNEMGSWSPERYRSDFALAELLLGKIDAVQPHLIRPEGWYALLNLGFHVPLLCGDARTIADVRLGGLRTYARLKTGEAFAYKNWVEAVRAGRTFATSGPLVDWTANGQGPGASVEVAAAGQAVQVRAQARSATPFARLELIAGGRVVGAANACGSPNSAVLEAEIPFDESGWLAARCLTEWPEGPGVPAHIYVSAHTSPVYVTVATRPPRPDPNLLATMTAHLDDMLRWLAETAFCENEERRQRQARIFEEARSVLLARQPGPLRGPNHTEG
jgi:hypothetical protein